MKSIAVLFVFFTLIVIPLHSTTYSQEKQVVDKCLSCHNDIGSSEAASYMNDVHYKAGVTCADCHGGDPALDDQDAAMSPSKGYVGVPKQSGIPQMCGKCHGPEKTIFKTKFHLDDVMDDFMSSIHGRALTQSSDGPQCTSCHGIHNISKISDTHSPVYPTKVTATCAKCHSNSDYMRKFNPGLPVDQYEKYLTSVHGERNKAGDPKPATCVSCHSNHLIRSVKDPRSPVYPTNIPQTCAKCHSNKSYMARYNIPTDQYDNYKRSVHGVALLQNSNLSAPACNSCHGNHGAVPPGFSSVASVCGTCHPTNADLFDKSPHFAVFTKAKLPGCVVCHSNHLVKPPSDDMIGLTGGAVCSQCHKPSDSAAADISAIKTILDSVTMGQNSALNLISRAENLGMDVSDASYSLKDANQSLVESRVQVHAFELAPLKDAAKPGLKIVAEAQKSALSAINEYYFRRQGLGVATLAITFLVILLYLKIRQIERKSNR
ncbi:MAG TPA: cytochrome c3 family protein [Candidatus Acidoferrales bacterium]|nr:cytochrome c3 family protein [Candidatus Acidoferrales bacterium]